MAMRLPLVALASLSVERPAKKPTESTEKSSETTSPDTNHIEDVTDQYIGKSMIITRQKPLSLTQLESNPMGRKNLQAS
jgi:hypothetical protein